MTIEQIVDEALPLTAFDLNCEKRTAAKEAKRALLTRRIVEHVGIITSGILAEKVNAELGLTSEEFKSASEFLDI